MSDTDVPGGGLPDGGSRKPRDEEDMPLDLLNPVAVRRRGRMVMIGAVIMAAAFGGIFGLIAGRTAGLITAAIVGVPLLLLAWSESRRRVWLDDGTVAARAVGVRRVDLRRAERLELLITQTRGTRTIGVLASGPPKGKTINIAVASYAGASANELGILALRRLANVLAGSENTGALIYSELLVAQLRAEARGDATQDRPLHILAAAAPAGKLAQRIRHDAVVQFVSSLD